jgi:hypothetical protein
MRVASEDVKQQDVKEKDVKESVELRPLPRAEIRLQKDKTNQLSEYEEGVRELERSRTYAQLTGEEVVLDRRTIGLAL